MQVHLLSPIALVLSFLYIIEKCFTNARKEKAHKSHDANIYFISSKACFLLLVFSSLLGLIHISRPRKQGRQKTHEKSHLVIIANYAPQIGLKAYFVIHKKLERYKSNQIPG